MSIGEKIRQARAAAHMTTRPPQANSVRGGRSQKLMGEQIRTLVLPAIDGVEYDVRIDVRLAE